MTLTLSVFMGFQDSGVFGIFIILRVTLRHLVKKKKERKFRFDFLFQVPYILLVNATVRFCKFPLHFKYPKPYLPVCLCGSYFILF